MTWPRARLGDVVVDVRSGFASGEDIPDGVLQFRMNNVTTGGALDLTKKRRVPIPSGGLNGLLLEPGDVLFNATNSPELVGKTAYFPGLDEPATFSNHFIRLRPVGADGRYLARWLTYEYQKGAFLPFTRHWVNQAAIDKEGLLNLSLPLPPLTEQRRTADILDRADALRTKRRQVSKQLAALEQSTSIDLFGETGRYRAECGLRPLGQLATCITDGVHKTPTYQTNGIPFVTVRNIVSGSLDLTDTSFIAPSDHAVFTRRTKPERGDLLVSKDGTIGVPCLVETDEPFSIFVSVALIKPRRDLIEPSFLHAQFRSEGIQRQIRRASKGAALRHLHIEDFRKLQVVVPPLHRQRVFSTFLDQARSYGVRLRASEAALAALFASLQHRAFRGEL